MNDRIWLVQCLCPARHCIAAIAFDPRKTPEDRAIALLRAELDAMIARGQIHPWCDLCHSPDWHYEAAPTKFATMEKATPHLLAEQFKQAVTKELLRERWKQDQ